ncbi:MAG: DUF493 domain-containing protein [Sulfurimonas sp.]|nr:MAG: DUF493 domain-containing protein [Sulfurimonas sp.]
MEILNDSDKKVEIQYPCKWSYKLIALTQDLIELAVKELIEGRTNTLTHSKTSKAGKYVSMNLDILVHNEDDRNFIYETLKKHQNIKMVL